MDWHEENDEHNLKEKIKKFTRVINKLRGESKDSNRSGWTNNKDKPMPEATYTAAINLVNMLSLKILDVLTIILDWNGNVTFQWSTKFKKEIDAATNHYFVPTNLIELQITDGKINRLNTIGKLDFFH